MTILDIGNKTHKCHVPSAANRRMGSGCAPSEGVANPEVRRSG